MAKTGKLFSSWIWRFAAHTRHALKFTASLCSS